MSDPVVEPVLSDSILELFKRLGSKYSNDYPDLAAAVDVLCLDEFQGRHSQEGCCRCSVAAIPLLKVV